MKLFLKSISYASIYSLAIGFLTLLATPQQAQAQDAAAAELDEVTVTARRREESLQDVPIAVSAFSGTQLEEIGAVDIVSLSQYTPNVTLEVSRATNTTLTAYIRGVGQQDPLAGFEGGVGMYLDDVYLARPQGTVFDLYDVERIEVLRGPQGTLYGRNTIGGAVKYVTRRLATEAELGIKASFGSFNQADLAVTGSLPVSDSFRVGATVATFNRDGYGKNQYTGEGNADKDIFAYRLSAEWSPADNLFVRLYGDYSIDESTPRQGHRLLPGPGGEPVLTDVFNTRAGASTLPASNAGLKAEVTQGGIGLLLQWDLNEEWQLKSITSSRSDESSGWIDFDNLPADTFDAPLIYENEQFSQEFQATYTGDRLAGVFGVYYLDANAFDAFDVVIFSSITAFSLGDYDTNAWAAYFDLTYDLNDEFSLSVGGRYTEDERTATVTRETFLGLGSPYFGNDSAISITPPVPGFVPTFNATRTDSAFTPRVSLSWHPVDEHNLYISYSEGFKGGGFDPRGAYGIPEVRGGFEPETVESIEIGAKSVWADGMITTNVAAFWMDYTNVQVPGSILLDTDGDGVVDGFAGVTTNAGKAEISGFEVEAIANVTDAFSVSAVLGFIDANYTQWLVGATDPDTGEPIFIDISDTRVFQNTPEVSGNLRARYEWSVGEGNLAMVGSVAYKGDSHQFEVADPLVDQDAYSLVDASLIWTPGDGSLVFGFHGRNLRDEKYIAANYNFPTVANSVIGFYGPPRTFTATATLNFD